MDAADIGKLKRRAQHLAKKQRLEREVDDFVGYALLKKTEGARGTIDQLWIDYLRENYGDLRKKHRKEQMRQFPVPVKPDHWITHETPERGVDFGFIQRFLSDNGAWFSQRDRLVLTLKYQWGFTNSEMADCLGVTGARVNQIVDEIETRIRAIIEAQLG